MTAPKSGTGKRSSANKPPKLSEHHEQVNVILWARDNEYRYPELHWLLAVINGAKLPYGKVKGKRFSPQALWLLAEGLRPGVFDLFLPCARAQFHGLWIELKVGYNKLTEKQAEFYRDMNAVGYLAVVCYSSWQAIQTLETYLGYAEQKEEDG